MTQTRTFPVALRKGDQTATAFGQADLVQLQFDGFSVVDATPELPDGEHAVDPTEDSREPNYRELQEQAKDLGINAGGTYDELHERVEAAETERAAGDES